MIRTVKFYNKPDGPRLDGHEECEKPVQKKIIVPDVYPRSKLRYAIGQAIIFLKEGIGVSRRAVNKEVGGNTSLIHSYETLERYVGIFNHFADTVLVDVKHIQQINKKHVETHFNNLVSNNRSENTIQVNASALNKLFNAFSRDDLIEYIDENRSTWAGDARQSNRTTPFNNPDKVINAIKEEAFKAAATIQLHTGARISDIKKVVNSVIAHPSRTSIPIMKSKGGKNRVLDFSDRMADFNIVLEAAKVIQTYLSENNNDWSSFQVKYTDAVHRAADKTEETYCGTHANRVNYANDQYEKGIKDNKNEVDVLKRLTEDLGHHRIRMAKYYLSAFRI